MPILDRIPVNCSLFITDVIELSCHVESNLFMYTKHDSFTRTFSSCLVSIISRSFFFHKCRISWMVFLPWCYLFAVFYELYTFGVVIRKKRESNICAALQLVLLVMMLILLLIYCLIACNSHTIMMVMNFPIWSYRMNGINHHDIIINLYTLDVGRFFSFDL